MRANGVWCDATDKIVASAEMNERVRVVGHPGRRRPVPTIEIHEVTGYAKQARRAAAALDRIGLARCDTDTLSLWAAAAGIDLAGFTITATVPLDPTDAGGRRVPRRARQPRRHDPGELAGHHRPVRHRVPPRPAHRGATHQDRPRRSQGRAARGRPRHGPQRFGWLADLTGPARDLDVVPARMEPLHRSPGGHGLPPRSLRCGTSSSGAAPQRTSSSSVGCAPSGRPS